MPKKITILGSTGSIGTQALDVIRAANDQVYALTANKSTAVLESQVREFVPKYVAMQDESAAKDLATRIADTSTKVLGGRQGILEIAADAKTDLVLNSLVGISGLEPTLLAINAGKNIALANKETLVAGGDLVKKAAKEKNIAILPVDSEHSAIFQSLQGSRRQDVKKILLTASGGPFYGKKREDLQDITPAKALAHPNWSMGAKISIDSATMMNKGLEVIEAVHLFDVSPQDIEVLVHRQSILHSAVEYADGAVIAQLGSTDMRLPIQYAITYPNRLPCPGKSLSLTDVGTLTFEKPDLETFGCLKTCIEIAAEGGTLAAAVNGANEQAVALFLQEQITFLQIEEFVKSVAKKHKNRINYTLEDVLQADAEAREYVLLHAKR